MKTTKKKAAKKAAPKAAPKSSKKSARAKAKSSKKPASVIERLRFEADKIVERVGNVFASQPNDIVAAIKMDHDSLRNFLKTLKDTGEDMTVRRRAYAQFSELLKSHSLAEEKVVYATAIELTGRELHIKIQEGFVEHHLADDIMKRIEKARDPMEWSAHANVLSEIVEHHLKEEDRDLLPLIRKGASAEVDELMLKEFTKLRARSQTKRTKKNSGVLEG